MSAGFQYCLPEDASNAACRLLLHSAHFDLDLHHPLGECKIPRNKDSLRDTQIIQRKVHELGEFRIAVSENFSPREIFLLTCGTALFR